MAWIQLYFGLDLVHYLVLADLSHNKIFTLIFTASSLLWAFKQLVVKPVPDRSYLYIQYWKDI